jgi:hypothetical protein
MVMALFAAADQASASSLPRTCGVQPGHVDPVTLVDGVVVKQTPDAALKTVEPESVFSIEVLCLNPKDSTLNRTNGIPAVSIVTKLGLQTSIKRMLSGVVDLQDGYFRLHARYLEQIESLAVPGRTEKLRVDLQVTPHGWLASSKTEGLTCLVYVGTVPGVPAGIAPREPTCVTLASTSVGS